MYYALGYLFMCTKKKKNPIEGFSIVKKSIRLPVGWFKLNADGASFGNPGKVDGGGLIRDHHGSWVKGYMRHIGFASSITTKF